MNKSILVTSGDIAGINLYIFLKAARKLSERFTIIINENTLKKYADFFSLYVPSNIDTIDIKEIKKVYIGKINKYTSENAYLSLDKSIEILKKEKNTYRGLITLPVNKNEMSNYIPDFKGHTEYLGKAFKRDVSMLLYSEKISVLPITTHISLKDVEGAINKQLLSIAYNNLFNFYKKYFHKKPKINILCVNPHCSDNKLLGDIDNRLGKILKGFKDISLPLPSDTAFSKNILKETDVYICMYHDQALIPFKMLSFYDGINITMGLPFLRISPDHGPAYEIVGDKKQINIQSIEKSIDFIIKKAPD